MQQLRDYVVAVRDDDVNRASATKMTSPENEHSADSRLVVVPAETASTSVWTTLDVAEQQTRQLVQPAGQGRQSLASVGNESSFFRKDAVLDEHLCSTPSQNDNVDEKVILQQQASSPCSDWTCAPAALDFSSGSPSMTRDVPGQRSPPVTSVLSAGRRYGCVQMPRLTPIIEADIELSNDDDDDDDDDSEVFVAAAQCVEVEFNGDDRQTDDDAVRPTSCHSERLQASSDVLDLTIVTPMTSLELTPLSACAAGSSSSELAPSNNESRDQRPEMDVDDTLGGTEIINRSRRDVDDLTTEETGQQQDQHESSYSGVYSHYMCADDNVNARRWEEWDLVDAGASAQDAVTALSLPPRRLTYQKSYLNRTPIDIGMGQLSADRVYRHRRRRQHHHHHQQQQQLSVSSCSLDRQTDALAGRRTVADDRASRSIRHRLSLYHENLI